MRINSLKKILGYYKIDSKQAHYQYIKYLVRMILDKDLLNAHNIAGYSELMVSENFLYMKSFYFFLQKIKKK